MSKYLKRLHFAPAKTRYISLQTGLRFRSREYEQPPYIPGGPRDDKLQAARRQIPTQILEDRPALVPTRTKRQEAASEAPTEPAEPANQARRS
jgi:hypothetical protein